MHIRTGASTISTTRPGAARTPTCTTPRREALARQAAVGDAAVEGGAVQRPLGGKGGSAKLHTQRYCQGIDIGAVWLTVYWHP
eukprot:m.871369 g.871369  ORF g.871369 m.871369 type:complete len:83 (-) comp23568_c0_seq33:1645-1893(-)